MNWFEAEDFCSSIGGNLASFETREGLSDFATGQQLTSRALAFWIGLNYLDEDKGYQWTDGTIVDFLNWDTNQPDNFNNIEQCTEMRTNQAWNDINCYVERGWICKIKKGIDPTVKPVVINEQFPGNFIKKRSRLPIFQILNYSYSMRR